jgi:hypothetical protein
VPTIRFQACMCFWCWRTTAGAFCILASPLIRPQSGPPSNCVGPSPGDSAALSAPRSGSDLGADFVEQVKAMGIKQVLAVPQSPWQRACTGSRPDRGDPRGGRVPSSVRTARRLNAPTWSRVTATNYSIADSCDEPFLRRGAVPIPETQTDNQVASLIRVCVDERRSPQGGPAGRVCRIGKPEGAAAERRQIEFPRTTECLQSLSNSGAVPGSLHAEVFRSICCQ